jgi:hypothetical protein
MRRLYYIDMILTWHLIPFDENGNDDCMVGYEFNETWIFYVEDIVKTMFCKESHWEGEGKG